MVDERGRDRLARRCSPRSSPIRELAREPGATVIHNLITSRAVPEIIAEHGGTPVRTRVGHSFIKARDGRAPARSSAASTPATSTSVTSGSPTPACSRRCTCSPRSASSDGPLSALLAGYERYVASGEINSEVADQAAATARVRRHFASRPGVSTDELDGLTVTGADWWFNVRPSNTEPLLRLNVEAADEATMAACATRCSALDPRHHGLSRPLRRAPT